MEDPRTEPSMDDILASIKRIIADDPPADGAPSAGSSERDDDDTPPALRDETPPATPVAAPAAPEPAPPAAPSFVPTPFPAEAAAPPASAPATPMPTPGTPVPAAPPTNATLVSENAASASRQSLAALTSMVVRPAGGGVTLDGLVGELLRPMLTEWLDAHLPAVVEKLVAREIARISAQQG